MFDVSEKLEDFIRKKAPLKAIIFDYYINFLPYFVNLFSYLFTFISVIFFTSKMASRTEIVAILSSGVSFRRMLRPYILGSLLLTLMSIILSNFIIPNANKKRLDFEDAYIGSPFFNSDENIYRQVDSNTVVYVQRFNNFEQVGIKFSMDKHHGGKLYYKLMGESIRWDSVKNKWTVYNYIVRTIDGMKETIHKGEKMDTTFNFQPKDFGRKLDNIYRMNFFELRQFIKDERARGSDKIAFYELEQHTRFSFPFASVILTLIGVAVSSRKVRGGIGLHLFIGLLLSFSFVIFMRVFTTIAASGSLPTMLAAWTPNIIFLALALYLLKLAPK